MVDLRAEEDSLLSLDWERLRASEVWRDVLAPYLAKRREQVREMAEEPGRDMEQVRYLLGQAHCLSKILEAPEYYRRIREMQAENQRLAGETEENDGRRRAGLFERVRPGR